MRLFPRHTQADVVVPVAAPVVFGYECPCGARLEGAGERALLEAAWAHAGGCGHEAQVAARAADATYGQPGHFHYDDGSSP